MRTVHCSGRLGGGGSAQGGICLQGVSAWGVSAQGVYTSPRGQNDRKHYLSATTVADSKYASTL